MHAFNHVGTRLRLLGAPARTVVDSCSIYAWLIPPTIMQPPRARLHARLQRPGMKVGGLASCPCRQRATDRAVVARHRRADLIARAGEAELGPCGTAHGLPRRAFLTLSVTGVGARTNGSMPHRLQPCRARHSSGGGAICVPHAFSHAHGKALHGAGGACLPASLSPTYLLPCRRGRQCGRSPQWAACKYSCSHGCRAEHAARSRQHR